MTPEQKVKWLICNKASVWSGAGDIVYPKSDIDLCYENLVDNDGHWDAQSEVRCGQFESGIECEYSRNYESKSVASQMPDGTLVGWTYFYGGGKFGDPDSIEWISGAYDVHCKEESELVVVRKFSYK